MEVSNDDIARILGRIEGKLDVQAGATKRVEDGLASLEKRVESGLNNLDKKVSHRLDSHDERLRILEVANPAKIAETVKEHDKRIQALENGAAKAGVVAGIGSGVAMAALIELVKRKMGM